MSMARRPELHDDVLSIIFEYVAQYTPRAIHGENIRRGIGRNVTLAAASRVCRAWTRTAQIALYRDITLGYTHYDVDYDCYSSDDDDVGPTCYIVGDVRPALQRLIWTLTRFHKRGDPLPSLIRSLHVGFGETDAIERGYLDSRRAMVVTHGTATQGARLISLCAGLRHLFLEIGTFRYGKGRRWLPVFSADQLALIAQLPKLQTLTLKNVWRREFIDTSCYGWMEGPLKPAQQILTTLAASVTHLNVDLYDVGWEAQSTPSLHFPNLREMSCRFIPHELGLALQHSAALETVILTREDSAKNTMHMLPTGLLHLTDCIRRGWCFDPDYRVGHDYSRFTKLRTLHLLDALNSADLLEALKTVSRTVERLTVHCRTLKSEKRATALSRALLRFPELKELRILCRNGAQDRKITYKPKAACAIVFVKSCPCCK